MNAQKQVLTNGASPMIEVETMTVKLGEREYTVQQAGFLRSKPWKKRLLTEIKPLFDEIGGLQGMEFQTPADLLKLMAVMESIFLDGIDSVFELLLAYAPALEEDRAYIEAHATDKQILFAFQGAVKLADPFGVVALMSRRYGLSATGTS